MVGIGLWGLSRNDCSNLHDGVSGWTLCGFTGEGFGVGGLEVEGPENVLKVLRAVKYLGSCKIDELLSRLLQQNKEWRHLHASFSKHGMPIWTPEQ